MSTDLANDRGGEGPSNPSQRRKWSKEEKKKRQGANKGRRFGKTRDTVELCWKIANGSMCDFGDGYVLCFAFGLERSEISLCSSGRCRFTHDVDEYLASKPPDIIFPLKATLTTVPPFVQATSTPAGCDPPTACPIYEETGECRHGLKCRFLGAHVKRGDAGQLEVLRDDEKLAHRKVETSELNYLGPDALKQLRSKKVGQFSVVLLWQLNLILWVFLAVPATDNWCLSEGVGNYEGTRSGRGSR